MGTIPAPNIADEAGQIAQAPINALAEFTRVAGLKAQTQALQQQTQQRAQVAPIDLQKQQLELQQQQLDMQDQQKVRDAYKSSNGDLDVFQKNLTTAGVGPKAALGATTMINGMRSSVNALGESDLKLAHEKHQQLAPVVDAISQMPEESQEAGWNAMLIDAQKRNLITPQEAQQHAKYPGPDGVKIYSNTLKTVDQLMAQRKDDLEAQKAQAGDWKEGGGGTLVNINPKSAQFGKVVHGAGAVDQQELNSYLTAPKLSGETLPPEQRNPATFLSWKAKQNPTALVMGNQLGQGGAGSALDQAAQRYSETGVLPAGFSRSPGTTTAILKRAAELNPDQSIAANTAAFKANQSSLAALQKNFDNVTAFENTAGKNLDVFLNTAKKVVDSGSPWINSPLRAVDAKALGSADQAAFNAARVTAITEIAKVLNSANASGVLSDSARHEVEGLIGKDATLKQIVSAANILKTDMGNRHQSYQEAIDAIKARTVNPKGSQPNAAAAAATHKVGDIITQNGQRFKATSVDANGKVTAADPL